MSVQNKPDYKVFASGAKSGEIETFPDILRGWGVTIDRTGEIPPMEWFNAIGKRVDEWLLYLTQRGIPEWDSSLDYPKSAVVTHSDVIYISLRASKGEQPGVTQAAWSALGAFVGIDGKLDKSAVAQSTGQSKTSVMSQDASTTELNKKFNITGGQIEGVIIAAGGNIVSKSGDTLIEVDSRISGKPRINVSANNGTSWFNQFLQMKSGTLGHINIATAAESGYLICGDTGIIIQWGIVSGSTSTSDYRQFPIPFKSACFQIVASYAEFGDNGMSTACYPTSKSEFIITKRSSTGALTSGNVRYIAVGY